ncbi:MULTISPECIES: TIGR02300 family protein [Acidiphilium]
MAPALNGSFPNLQEAVMAKPELGDKHTCVSCGARFFDLGRQPAICPKCGTEQPIEQPKLKRAASMPEDVKKPVKAAVVPGDDVEVDAADDAADEDILEDTEDLDDDADAIEGDIEVERDPDETEH